MKNLIIITGGAGFVGSNLIEFFLKKTKKNLISLDNYSTGSIKNHIKHKRVKYIRGNTRDIGKTISKYKKKIHSIFHFGEFARIYQSFEKFDQCFDFNSIGTKAVIYFYNVYGPRQISKGKMATVIGIFEELYKRNKPLTVVRPGSQTRRFTHINDTINICYEAWKKNKCRYYSISNKKSYSILDVAKMFKSNIIFLKSRSGERYASALTRISQNNKIIHKYGKINLKDYITSFIKDH